MASSASVAARFVDVADDNDPQDVPGKQVRVHCLEIIDA